MWRVLAVVMAVAAFAAPGLAADEVPNDCEDVAVAASASEAFDAYCARCHDAASVSAGYFEDISDAAAADEREAELAAFLDRHGGCPHRHHEDVAQWLRDLAQGE